MFGRNTRNETSEEMRQVRDRATAESWPMNDPRANYDAARRYRQTRAEGRANSQPS